MKSFRYLALAALTALLGLGSAIGSFSEGAFSQAPECTVTVQPGESIQQAIDQAQEGDVICLTEGTWEENVKIEKSLTLRGAAQEKTVIKGKEEGYPVIWITTPEEEQTVSVKVEELKVTGAEGRCADGDQEICPYGILIQGIVQVEIADVIVAKNQEGIGLWNSAHAIISNTTVTDNLAHGITLHDSSQAEITASIILGNQGDGVFLDGSTHANITNSVILQNRIGISVDDSPHIALFENQITANRGWGVLIGASCSSDSSSSFPGSIIGSENIIHSNQIGAVCPGDLDFLLIRRGVQIILELQIPESLSLSPDDVRAIGGWTIQVLNHRLTEYGLDRVIVTRLGWRKILVQLIHASDLDESVQSLVSRMGFVEFKKVVKIGSSPEDELSPSGPLEEVLRDRQGIPYVVEREPLLTGAALLGAQVILDLSGKPLLILTFTEEGTRWLSEVIQDLGAGSIIAFVLDEVIQSVVTMTAQLVDIALEDWRNLRTIAIPHNGYTWQEANIVAIIINSGSFPVPVQVNDIRMYSESYPLVGLDRPRCTVAILPEESVQTAIDQAQEGDVICLAEGTWEENVRIEKSLTLRGRGAEQTVIDGTRKDFPVVWITAPADQAISVRLEDLRITGAEGQDCLDWEQRLCTSGVTVQGRAQVEVRDAAVSRNGSDPFGYGLMLSGSARVSLVHTTLEANPSGIELSDAAQLEFRGSTTSGGRWGITLQDTSRAEIIDSSILGIYGRGLQVKDSARATITRSTISGTRWAGIEAADSAQAEVYKDVIEGNYGCGIAAWGKAEVRGHGNRMSENAVDLCGNLSGDLRIPLVQPSEREILYPDPDGRYETLQQAVDALLPGGRIILRDGEHLAGLTIAKELTIAAAEGAQVVLKGRSERDAPVLSLIEGAKLTLVGLKVTGGETGLLLRADSQAEVRDSLITQNAWAGIDAGGISSVEVICSTLSWNGDGIGLKLKDSARATVAGSVISENNGGLWGRDSAQLTLENSTVTAHRVSGIMLENAAEVHIRDSLISGNENGVLLADSVQALIEGNTIIANEGYGVALYIRSCGFEGGEEAFLGRIVGRGNVIPGPDEPEGNRQGAVCPEELEFLMTEAGGEHP